MKSDLAVERQAVALLEEVKLEPKSKRGSASDLKESSRSVNIEPPSNLITVSGLLASIPDEAVVNDPTQLFRYLPDALSLLEELTTDELFVLFEDLSKMSEDDSKAEALIHILLTLVADVEPERVIAFFEGVERPDGLKESVEPAALGSLAMQDPAQAEAFLKNADWTEYLKENAKMAVLSGWIQTDFQEAIRYLKENEMGSGRGMMVLANAGHDPKVRDQMRKVIRDMEDSSLRKKMSIGLVKVEYDDGGPEAVNHFLSEMAFATPKARDELLSGAANIGLMSKPQETIEWLQKEVSPARRGQFLSDSISIWAHQDFQAAGEWLKNQKLSSDTDHAISGYATTVTQVDPPAAMAWIDEILDRGLQQEVRKDSLKKWHNTDPAAARNWVVEQGWEVEEWFPNSE